MVDRLLLALKSWYDSGDQRLLVQAEAPLVAGNTKGMARASAFFGVQPELTELHCHLCSVTYERRACMSAAWREADVPARCRARFEGRQRERQPLRLREAAAHASGNIFCRGERSFSVLRRLKTWLCTTLGQERLSQAAVLASYPRRLDELDTEAEMRRFAADTTQRANAFGRW